MDETLIRAGGVFHFALVVFHLLFWRLFDWNTDLRSLSVINRAVVPVLNLSLTFLFALFGFLSLFHSRELSTTGLGRSLLVGLALFWAARAMQQIVFFKLRHWMSWVFLLIFSGGAVLYAVPAIHGFQQAG